MDVYIVSSNYSTDEGTWERIIQVCNSEIIAELRIIELDEKNTNMNLSYFYEKYEVKEE